MEEHHVRVVTISTHAAEGRPRGCVRGLGRGKDRPLSGFDEPAPEARYPGEGDSAVVEAILCIGASLDLAIVLLTPVVTALLASGREEQGRPERYQSAESSS